LDTSSKMTQISDDKASLESLPAYEQDNAAVDTAADTSVTAGTERNHWLRKVLPLFVIMAPLLWLFNCGWRGPYVFKEANQWDLRKRRIDTGSQSLDAEFDLLDLLSIRSTSGSLNVGIHPQPANEKNPVPAEVLVSSWSGSLSVNFPPFNVPEREYHVSIDSRSGSIAGTILHGRKTSITSRSSMINVQLAPYGTGDYSSTLSTTSYSGSQDITILNPVMSPGTSINKMSSVHSAHSGSMTLRYPREWEGTIEGHTRSGSMNLYGRDLDVIRRVGHYVLAKKGNGSSTLNFHTNSGSVDVYFD
jgi:hypothetical protein